MSSQIPYTQENEIHDLGSLHHYRTEIPNILFLMKLEPMLFKAYCVLKMTAGDKGSCFKSNKTLSDEIGCSLPTVMKLKEQLAELGLIRIMKRRHESGGCMPDLVQITDIWAENMEEMVKKYPKKANSNFNGGCKPDLQGGVNSVNRGCKPGLHKQEHKEEKEIYNNQQHAASPIAAVFSEKRKMKKPEPKIWECLNSIDIPMNDKIEITRRYSEEIVKKAIAWATHAKNPPTKCLAASIKYACKNSLSGEEFNKKRESVYENLKQIFTNGNFYNKAECFLNSHGIGFNRGNLNDGVKFDRYFSTTRLNELLEKFQIDITQIA
jgi:hypothetical protein